MDATVGSALDIFGGSGCTYEEVVAFHRQVSRKDAKDAFSSM